MVSQTLALVLTTVPYNCLQQWPLKYKLCAVVSLHVAPSDSLEQHSVQHVGGRPGEEEWSPHHSSFCAGKYPLSQD